MLDLTPEIKLEKETQKQYLCWRNFLFIAFFLGAIYFVYIVLFPTAYFNFPFLTRSSSNNTFISPHKNDYSFPLKGEIEGKEPLFFETTLLGNYSEVEVEFKFSKKSELLEKGQLSLRKGYRSFFYPEAETTETLFEKDANGRQSGDLVSYGDAVYVISKNFIHPIDSVETFSAHGYSWDDLQKVSPDIVSGYEKERLFVLNSFHPDGTIFLSDSGKYYLVDNFKKKIISPAALSYLPKRNPILVSEKSLEIEESCELKKSRFFRRSFFCAMPLEKFSELLGSDFQFKADFEKAVRVDEIKVRFRREFSLKSLKGTLSQIIFLTKKNYTR